MDQVTKYDPAYFDEEFYRSKTGAKGGKRDTDSGHYFTRAVALYEALGKRGLSWLVVGAGMGWVPRHLQNLGEKVESIDVSDWAVQNAVVPVTKHDVLELEHLGKKWGVLVKE